jgi:protocadherin Fat 4
VQGSQVGKVTAVDGDKGANADISYDLVTEWGKEVFSLDPATGIFTLTAELDYERTEHYIFVVSATDNGSPAPLSSTVTVYINVKDVNDNAPVFGEAAYAAAVAEDVAVGASILQVGLRFPDQLAFKDHFFIVSVPTFLQRFYRSELEFFNF